MEVLKWMAGGLVGAAIGGAIWIAVGYFANYEVGWIAWGIGFLAGLGVRIAAGEKDGPAPGVVAVGIAVLTIVVSKYLVVSMLVDKSVGEIQFAFEPGPETGIRSIAYEMVEDLQAQGQEVAEPDEAALENDVAEDDFPEGVWEQATQTWEAMTPAEQQARLDKDKAEFEAAFGEMGGNLAEGIKQQAFKESFAPWDLLWFGLAALTAFRMGSGAVAEET